VELLSDHMAEGRLTQSEFNDRLGLVLNAKTAEDLEPVFIDLPGPNPGRPSDLERLEEQQRREANALLAETRAKRQVAKADPRLIAALTVAVGLAWTATVIIYFSLYGDWKIFIVPIALSIALAKLKGQAADRA
ncbi:MAG TPA: DUF1707 domain-containing protein, partial [Propionibacteriaceae bacterium]|nr:DUF1707 domain-containing protein [Propionibacteriaceae bacterium]